MAPVRFKFEPRDLWFGAFIDTEKRLLYLCLVPCFPVILVWRWWTPFAPTVALCLAGIVAGRLAGVESVAAWWFFALACGLLGAWLVVVDAVARSGADGA